MNKPLQLSDDLLLLDLSDTERAAQLRAALIRLRMIDSLLAAARRYDIDTPVADLLATADGLLEQAFEIVAHLVDDAEATRPDTLGEALNSGDGSTAHD